MTRRAVFLDRDGTLIRDTHHIGDPELVELLPGVGDAVHRLNKAGWPVVIVTNQSGIARGLFTQADFERVQARVEQLLAYDDARVDGRYVCPHYPAVSGPCDCRKPGTLLYRQAADRLDLELKGSWYIGDHLRDIEPSKTLGGRGLLVPWDETTPQEVETALVQFGIAASLDDAVQQVIESG